VVLLTSHATNWLGRDCTLYIAGVGSLSDLSNEDRRRRVIETLADRLADANSHLSTTGTNFIGIAQVDHFSLAR